MNRRDFLKSAGIVSVCFGFMGCATSMQKAKNKRPNILLALSDDQSWPHASAYGCKFVNTPTFDRIAREGVLFTHAYSPAPNCSPSRAALLTGQNIWQLEEAANLTSRLQTKFDVYPSILEAVGYHVGFTGKGWAPGCWKESGWDKNPAGTEYNEKMLGDWSTRHIMPHDYAGNFEDFLKARPSGTPFCFWFGSREPHRSYEKDSGLDAGKKLDDVDVPKFLPDDETVRSDLLDYALEIEWFDDQLGKMVETLEKIGELDNTIIVITSDNGMPFPRAKNNLYEAGTHMPMAIRWADKAKGSRVVDDFISFIDLAPTFLEAAGVNVSPKTTGRSLLSILLSEKSGRIDNKRSFVLTGRERHVRSRPNNQGYPSRAIRTYDYLYIRNFNPDRWPAGNPDTFHDIDGSPTKTLLLEKNMVPFTALAIGKRPAEELYEIKTDPDCINNLAYDKNYEQTKEKLRKQLEKTLFEQEDPRITGNGDIFEQYPYCQDDISETIKRFKRLGTRK